MPPLHPRHRRPGRAPARGAGRSVAQSACRQTVAAASRTPPGDRRGVGAVLGQIGQAHPEVLLSGIDFKAQQIASARNHLTGPGLKAVELLVGDPAQRPWPDGHFDRVRLAWVVDHLADPLAVLRPVGTIYLTETNRDAHTGARLGPLLEQGGFTAVDNRIVTIHHWCPGQWAELERFCAYLLQFISPKLPALLAAAEHSAGAALIYQRHDRFTPLAERDNASASIWASMPGKWPAAEPLTPTHSPGRMRPS